MGGASIGLIRPMLATLGAVPATPGWSYEFKWDGIRAIGYVGSGGTRLLTRNDHEVSVGYPEIAGLNDKRDLVLDGELVALDAQGRPDFGRLQRRIHTRPTDAMLADVPVQYYVFDLLRVDGQTITDLPYLKRRELLARLALDRHPSVAVPPTFPNSAGQAVLAAAQQHGLEGVMAKRDDSIYRPGRRDRSWIKTPLRHRQEVIICGWTPGQGRRDGSIGSLLLGSYNTAGELVYLGNVGTGFTQRMLTELHRQLLDLEAPTPPFDAPVPREDARHARWCRPVLAGEVEYRSWTPENRLRHPAWKGLRPDRQPKQIIHRNLTLSGP